MHLSTALRLLSHRARRHPACARAASALRAARAARALPRRRARRPALRLQTARRGAARCRGTEGTQIGIPLRRRRCDLDIDCNWRQK